MRRFLVGAALLAAVVSLPAQQMVTETRDPAQTQDEDFAKSVKEWTTKPYYISPLVDHLPKVPGIPSPKDVLGYHIGAPYKRRIFTAVCSICANIQLSNHCASATARFNSHRRYITFPRMRCASKRAKGCWDIRPIRRRAMACRISYAKRTFFYVRPHSGRAAPKLGSADI